MSDLLVRELAYAWEDFEFAARRRQTARAELEALYDEARMPTLGFRTPRAARSRKWRWPDFSASPAAERLRQLASALAGGRSEPPGAQERQVCRQDDDRTHRAAVFRAIINQMALPLVKRDRLYGAYYHHKTGVQKMPGKKAMTAVSRKIVKMIWGWYRSGAAFDATRVFTCAGRTSARRVSTQDRWL